MSKDALSKKDVLHIALLANLVLQDDEISIFQTWLGEAIENIEVLREVSTDNVKETSQVTGLLDVFREDVIKSGFTQAEALLNAPHQKDGYFQVPLVLEK